MGLLAAQIVSMFGLGLVSWVIGRCHRNFNSSLFKYEKKIKK